MGITLEFIDGPSIALQATRIELAIGAGTGTPGADGSDGADGADGADGLVPSRNDHGTITTSVTIGEETEHTLDHTGNITVNIDNLTAAGPSRQITNTVSGGGSPSWTLASSQTIQFRGSDTLSSLADGEHDILLTWNGVRVLVRVEAL